jgi:hypothetical protein
MRATGVFIAMAVVSCLPVKGQAQTDSLTADTGENIIWYFDIGLGPNTRGANFDLSFTLSSANVMGGSINFRAGYVTMKDIPSDYYEGFMRKLAPASDFIDLSLNLTLKFSGSEKHLRFGFETGPSFLWYDKVELVLNPRYPDLFEYKYNKIRTVNNTIGFHCAMKFEIPALDHLGCSFILFCNINNVQSLFGLDVCISLGKVRKKSA